MPLSPSSNPIPLEPLTPATFAAFGHVLQRPSAAGIPANQGTATKHAGVSVHSSTFPASSPAASTNLNIFVCSPRAVTPRGHIPCPVLERHPYSTQTFIPLAADAGAWYVVVVAPTGEGGRPDMKGVRAFRAERWQGVTYAKGTWHAPMVVGGESGVGFVVVVGENGVAEEETEEVEVGEGGILVAVGRAGGLWRL